MSVQGIEFGDLGASRLFLDYLSGNPALQEFYETFPFTAAPPSAEHADRVTASHSPAVRALTTRALHDLHVEWQAPAASLDSIERLSRPDALCVVAGQQVNLLGGPLFTAYKALDAVLEARRASQALGRPVVPVFWLADEDHDLDEILPIGLPAADAVDGPTANRMTFPKSSWDSGQNGGAVGRLPVPATLPAFIEHAVGSLPEAPFAAVVQETLLDAYRPGRTLREAFGRLLLRWFGPMGLIVMVGDHPEFKRSASALFVRSVHAHQALHDRLIQTGTALRAAGYHEQVTPTHGHLFHLSQASQPAKPSHPPQISQASLPAHRAKIRRQDSLWRSTPSDGDSREWTDSGLEHDVARHPENFSPDALLRLGYQSHLLPVVQVITGPAETAYYAQALPLFQTLSLPMPEVRPRRSLTLFGPASRRRLAAVPFEFRELRGDIHRLREAWVRRLAEPDPETLLDQARRRIAGLDDLLEPWLAQIDPTLIASQRRAAHRMDKELDRLRRKIYRSLIRREEHHMRKLDRLRASLFPGGGLQEREVSAFALAAQQGEGVWERLAERMTHLPCDAHHLVDL